MSGPIVLPLLALYASRQRGRLDSEAAQAELQSQVEAALRQVALLSEESAADVAEEVAALVDEVRQGRSSPEKAVRSVEAKLSAVQDAVRTVEESTKEALSEAATQRTNAIKELTASMGALRRDVREDLRQTTGDELAALGRVDSRLAALEGALAGLEVAQSESLRRLGSSVNGAMVEGREVVAGAVRDEVWQSLEPVRQLPQMLAVLQQQIVASTSTNNSNNTAPHQGGNGLDVETLRAVVAEEVSAASALLLRRQRDILLESPQVKIAPEQWNQLGKRLVSLDDQMREIKEGGGEVRKKDWSEVEGREMDGLRLELMELSRAMKEALQEQQRNSVVAQLMASPSSASLDVLVLAPLEASLLQVKSEMESSMGDERPEVVEKMSRIIAPVLEVITAARQQLSVEHGGLEENTTTTAMLVSDKLDALSEQLASLEERMSAFKTSSVAVATTAAVQGPPLPRSSSRSSSSTGPASAEILGEDEEAVVARQQAYARMQNMLHGDDSNGNNTEEESTADSPPLGAAVDEKEFEREEAYQRMQASLHSSDSDSSTAEERVAISEWLSGNEEEEEEEEQDVVAIGSSVAKNSNGQQLGSSIPQSRRMLVQEQIAFEAGLAAAPLDIDVDVDGDEHEQKEEEGEASPSSSGSQPTETATTTITISDAEQEALYKRGLELLRQGRDVGSSRIDDWDALVAAEAALSEAIECFQAAATATASADPMSAIKAIGNAGNAIMALARVKRSMASMLVASGGAGESEEQAMAILNEAIELLVIAGRKYRQVLQTDDSQGRAFINWGRAVCLRAEIAREGGDAGGALVLYKNAADKFKAAEQLRDVDPGEALKLAGTALMSAAECVAVGVEGGGEDIGARLELLEEAEGLLGDALDVGLEGRAVVDVEYKLEEIRAQLM